MTCDVIHTECAMVGDRVPVTLDFSQVAARRWRAGALYQTGQAIRGTQTGFEFVAGGDGQTGAREPKWPKVLAGTVQDGSIEWTAAAVSIDSLMKVLSSVEWDAPASITVSGESVNTTAQTALAYLAPTEAGEFEIIVRPTFNDSPAHIEGFIVAMTVS